MDCRIELITVPVTDTDRAIAFYRDQCGFTVDHDHRVSDELRFVQVTPPGSACSICFGDGLGGQMEVGGQKGIQVVVDDIQAARQSLVDAGVEVTEVDEMAWGKFGFFADPDGNAWTVQEIPARG